MLTSLWVIMVVKQDITLFPVEIGAGTSLILNSISPILLPCSKNTVAEVMAMMQERLRGTTCRLFRSLI